MKTHPIVDIDKNGIGFKSGLRTGDQIIRINGHVIEDVFDYEHFVYSSEKITVDYLSAGKKKNIIIENHGQNLGLVFKSNLIDEYRRCRNNCLFCFIGQLPPQLKPRLSLKEDDCRKSFFPWNRYEAYCTLIETPMDELERYVRYGLSPVNISIHSTDPETRVKIFRNPHAYNTMEKLKYLYNAKVEMNALIVLCHGINDRDHLEKTLSDLFKLAPVMKSVAIGPVGMTRFRKENDIVTPLSSEDAQIAIQIIEKYQKLALDKYGISFAQGSDLLYYLANKPVPEEAVYDEGLYHQLGNGVGMVRMFCDSFLAELEQADCVDDFREISIATGTAFFPILRELLDALKKKAPNITIHIYEVKNNYFGGNVVVAGLTTAADLMDQLSDKPLGTILYLSSEMIGGSGKFIDGISIKEVEEYLGTELNFDTSTGAELVRMLLGKGV